MKLHAGEIGELEIGFAGLGRARANAERAVSANTLEAARSRVVARRAWFIQIREQSVI